MNTEHLTLTEFHLGLLFYIKTSTPRTVDLGGLRLKGSFALQSFNLIEEREGRLHATDKGRNLLTLLVEVFNDNVNL